VATTTARPGGGLGVRPPDPADRRRNAITLTDEGRRHLKHLDALIADGEAEFLVPLSEVDRAELTRILKLIVGYHSRL
jgi:DNA-binding MarR family transcriptional regulator